MSRREGYVWHESRPSALSTFFKSTAFVVSVGIACGTGLAFRGMTILNSRAGEALGMAGQAFEDLPTFIKQLPPVLSDALKDRRAPEYVGDVHLSGRVLPGTTRRGGRAVIEIENRGDKVVSLLALRAVILDEDKQPMGEETLYGATPLAVEDEWRGPLFPSSKRRVLVWCPNGAESVELEIADLRTWNQQESAADDGSAKAELTDKSVASR